MRYAWRTVSVALILATLFAAVGCSPLLDRYVDLRAGGLLSRAQRLVREGERLAAEGDETRALLAFRQAYTSDPRYLPAIRRLAAAYEAQGRRRLAAHFYEQLLAAEPDDREALQALIGLYDTLGQPVRADEMRRSLGMQAQATSGGHPPAADAPTLLWGTFLEEQAVSGLALGGDALYATTQGGSLIALDGPSGEIRWRFAARKPVVSGPIYSQDQAEDLVLFGADDNTLYAVSAADGQERWRFEAQAPIHGAPAVARGTVYFGSTDGSLYAVDRSTGALRWEFPTGGAIHAAPFVSGPTVYAGSLDRNVYAVDADTGAERWRFAALTGVESTSALLGDLLFVGADDSRLYCLQAETGEEVWRYSTGDAVFARPVVGRGAIYVASASHALYALSPQDGELRWRFDAESFLRPPPLTARPSIWLRGPTLICTLWMPAPARYSGRQTPATGPLPSRCLPEASFTWVRRMGRSWPTSCPDRRFGTWRNRNGAAVSASRRPQAPLSRSPVCQRLAIRPHRAGSAPRFPA
jgi:outer membrane protein assembly factor BamB